MLQTRQENKLLTGQEAESNQENVKPEVMKVFS